MLCLKLQAFFLLLLLLLPDADIEKITAVLLKSRTGEFDLESILFLKFRSHGKLKSVYEIGF